MSEKNKNNFSYWFHKVKNCGIKVPESVVIEVPEMVQRSFWCYDSGLPEKEWNKNIDDFLEKNVIKIFDKHPILFCKNATFSNKFSFKNCISRKDNIKNNIMEINYAALLLGAGGLEEIVLREVIPCDKFKTPCIYEGMPLQSEFRVFYDFDSKKILYIENYWNYEYCIKSMHNATDKIIFEHERVRLERDYEKYKGEVLKLVSEKMKEVELIGNWSVDILLDEKGDFWLIDMAIAENSAYWDKRKVEKALKLKG